jgi:acyl-CoA thioester hydrolase
MCAMGVRKLRAALPAVAGSIRTLPHVAEFKFPVTVRYYEVDAQGVVFNMWYLAWFDEALTAFLDHRGLPYQKMLDAGFDVQVVHTELDYRAGVRWPDGVHVAVEAGWLGRTSFTLEFAVHRGPADDPEIAVTGSTVYVVIGTDGTGKRPIPDLLRDALHAPAGTGSQPS